MKLLTGNSNKPLSKNIAKYLKTKLINSSIKKFSDGEIYIEINENIRGNSIFIIQSISSPANDNLMELLLCIDALKRSSAKNITAVIPYFGYARQARKLHWDPEDDKNRAIKWNELEKKSLDRLDDLFAENIEGSMGLGSERSLDDYATISGIDLKNKKVLDLQQATESTFLVSIDWKKNPINK